ncbi:unnamed protein product [Lactuca saligna]|uniref:Uncharacterized protein n=1 Tax=Lactuca saligna TaxID=75948 RepID=A0AA35YVI3_LACSI|nr:unnamed protein product [Lactuca saligna]
MAVEMGIMCTVVMDMPPGHHQARTWYQHLKFLREISNVWLVDSFRDPICSKEMVGGLYDNLPNIGSFFVINPEGEYILPPSTAVCWTVKNRLQPSPAFLYLFRRSRKSGKQ